MSGGPSVQWFPGHMHATRKALAERLPLIDVVIEMLDARLPGSSANPLLAEATQGKAALKILNKQDLADPLLTARWLAHYNAMPATQAIALDAGERKPARALVAACQAAAPGRGTLDKPLRVLICGVPNVGKSTLINTLTGKRSAKTGDEAGITKTEQPIALAPGITLYDTPGILWPRIAVPQSGAHLAASGAVGRNAYDEESVALDLLASIRRRAPECLLRRYQIDDAAAQTDDGLLAAIARRRGALGPGGRTENHKAAEILLNDFRMGELGQVTLETPEELAQWQAEAAAADAVREAEREARRRQRAAGRRRR